MKMDRKLTLLFSLLTVLITLVNSIYAYHYNIDLLKENTFDTLSAVGKKMLSEVEAHLELMNFAVEELTSNMEFMNVFRKATMENEVQDEQEQLAMQQLIYKCLYSEPLMENFYRVSVYAPNGFYLSNHFEKADAIISMSEEAKELIASLPYLEDANTSPSTAHIVPPHQDSWSTSSTAPAVISAVKAVHWHGQLIGYIEVSSNIEELVRILTTEDLKGVSAHVVLDDGRSLFRFFGDDAAYPDASDSDMMVFTLEDGSQRFALRLHSKSQGLSVFIAQDISSYHVRSRQLLMEHLGFSSIILVCGVLAILIMSRSLTRSIRSLTSKIQQISSRKVVDHTADLAIQTVTSPKDHEIFSLEQSFNDLLMRLRKSAQREITLQNSTLQAQLNALQTQINPHFVYNTLNIISAKGMESGNEEIMEICDQFAQMLRYATDVRARSATLAAEVQNAEHYLLLAKARYEEQLQFSICMPEGAEDLLLPKLTLQPLVENALTHGFREHNRQRIINLTGVIEDSLLRLTIRDNGSGFSEQVLSQLSSAFADINREHTPYSDPANGHIGLINTYMRLHHYSRGKIRMSLYNDGGAVVELILPCERSTNHV